MSGRTRIRGLLGGIAIVLLVAAVVAMVKNPDFFGEEAALDRLFKAHPKDFAACLNIDTYSYEARVEEDGPYGERSVAMRYRRVPLASRSGKTLYRFELPGDRNELFASFATGGEVTRLYRKENRRAPVADEQAMVLSFSRAHSDGAPADGLSVHQRFPSSGPGTLYVHGHFLLTERVKQPPDAVMRCMQTSEEEQVRLQRLVEVPVLRFDVPSA